MLLVRLLNQAAERLGEPVSQSIEIPGPHFAAELPIEARLARQAPTRGIQARDRAGIVDHDQAAADVDRGGLADLAMRHHRELRRAAADVDIQQMAILIVRQFRRA